LSCDTIEAADCSRVAGATGPVLSDSALDGKFDDLDEKSVEGSITGVIAVEVLYKSSAELVATTFDDKEADDDDEEDEDDDSTTGALCASGNLAVGAGTLEEIEAEDDDDEDDDVAVAKTEADEDDNRTTGAVCAFGNLVVGAGTLEEIEAEDDDDNVAVDGNISVLISLLLMSMWVE
jgi:hypothetical protein